MGGVGFGWPQAGLAIWFVVVWPLQYLKDIAPSRHEYDRGIETDFESGRCLIYQTAPMEMLPEPAYGRDCQHLSEPKIRQHCPLYA